MAALTSTNAPKDRIVIPSGSLEQNNTNPIRLKIIPNVPIAGCRPRSGIFFQNANFCLLSSEIFPNSFSKTAILASAREAYSQTAAGRNFCKTCCLMWFCSAVAAVRHRSTTCLRYNCLMRAWSALYNQLLQNLLDKEIQKSHLQRMSGISVLYLHFRCNSV
jgi:hypothetical protein